MTSASNERMELDWTSMSSMVVTLKAFSKSENITEALAATTLLIDSKPSKGLRKFLHAHCEGVTLAMADTKLGKAIQDKLVDIMLIQAIGNMDDLDKELNISAMRLREWYGWHFPELAKILQDNILHAKTVKMMRDRTNAAKLDFSEIMLEELEIELKEAAMTSMGTEVCELDLNIIVEQCDQVISLAKLRAII
ncbi:hypothetical protein RJ639_004498 [Escallonia herrerae]|uniref:NOSIC domain-containing protein n=1 Tax=Escallonia herrerae TaxID=1293975 RepID=A0AA88W2Q5_9ASTE|nr:hypothetical protein RJ639_004498 [Escallonia herrerae]